MPCAIAAYYSFYRRSPCLEATYLECLRTSKRAFSWGIRELKEAMSIPDEATSIPDEATSIPDREKNLPKVKDINLQVSK